MNINNIGFYLCAAEVRDLMRKWRENNERNSEDVIELWETILEDKVSKLGNESMCFVILIFTF